jgi:hypothetical protein
MPTGKPRAIFKPISPHLDLQKLVEATENFKYVDRISHHDIDQRGIEQLKKLILLHVVIGGKPLVIEGFDEKLEPLMFTPQWLRDNHGGKSTQIQCLASLETNSISQWRLRGI